MKWQSWWMLISIIIITFIINHLYSKSVSNHKEDISSSYTPIGNYKNNLSWWDGGSECACSQSSGCAFEEHHIENQKLVGGSCGRRAWMAGPHQSVVSYSLYGNNPEYWVGLEDNIQAVLQFYPGYQVWLFTNPRERKNVLCPLLKKYINFHICDVQNLPTPIGNIGKIHPMVWRSTPLGDQNVDILLVRDTDSMITNREVSAVNDWLHNSIAVIHTMRDNPGHNLWILGGMWGVRMNTSLYSYDYLAKLRSKMFKDAFRRVHFGFDQNIFKENLIKNMQKHLISHDSFFCMKYPNSRPWPTRRKDGEFVGNPIFRKKYKDHKLNQDCPFICRPRFHNEWTSC